jgi:hypothetical protein
MPVAALFDTEKFASILKAEIDEIARKRYGGSSNVSLGKAFAFWLIRTMSPDLRNEQVELARSICEGSGPGDENIDGAWVDGTSLHLIQSKYSQPDVPTDNEESFRPPLFGAEPAEELELGFHRLYDYVSGRLHEASPGRKLIQLAELYRKATEDQHLRIDLVVAVSGRARKSLFEKVQRINSGFEADRKTFPKHHCQIYDLYQLNQRVSQLTIPPPQPVYLEVIKSFELKNPDDTIYAVAATASASELIRIRELCGYSLYHSNFRFLLTRGGVARPKIEKTIASATERVNFWRYNNGITISCETVRETSPGKYEIKELQVVNGLQTIEALFDSRNQGDWSKDVAVLVRVIPTKRLGSTTEEEAHELEEHIAEYSNSQTPIRPRDLRSNDAVQFAIERVMGEVYGLKYIRKVGEEPGLRGRPSRDRVDNEEAAQAALAFWHGLSAEAKGKRKLIFEREASATPGYYDRIFNSNTTAEYLLLPYLLWDNQYQRLISASSHTLGGIYRNLDLLALAVVGDYYKSIRRLSGLPSHADAATKILRSSIEKLRNGQQRKERKLWTTAFTALHSIAERRRRAEAKKRDLPLEDISLRNIIVKMRYSERDVKSQIRKNVKIRTLPKVLRDMFD